MNPCPLEKPYISLVNKVETPFLLISLQRKSKSFYKTIAAQVHGSNFVSFNFLENGDFFCNIVESSEFLNSLTNDFYNIKRLLSAQKLLRYGVGLKKCL